MSACDFMGDVQYCQLITLIKSITYTVQTHNQFEWVKITNTHKKVPGRSRTLVSECYKFNYNY